MESKYCKKSSRKAQYFIVFLLFIATIFSTGCAPKSIPKAQNGFFDLSLWNFEQDGEIELNGEWEFYWEKIYSYEDFHNPGLSQKLNSEKQLFQVPGPWNSFVKNLTGNKYPGRGFATLRLRTSLPPGELAVFNFWTASAYKLYCGDRLVLSAGKSEPESPIPYNGAKSGRLENCSELIWQISNYDHHFGGPRQTIRLATPTRNAILNTRKDLIETLLVGVTSIFAAYHFLLWLFRREDRLALLFSGVCFSFCMLDLSSEKYFQRILHTNVFALQYKIEFASVVSGVIFTAAFFRAFFPNELPAFFARLLTIVGTSYALYVILVPGTGFTEYVLYMQIYVMIAVVFLLAGSVLAIYRRRPYGFALGIGFIILPFLAVHDILSVRNIISTPRMVPYGILILIFTQSGILAKIFATAHNTAEHLSANLKAEVERKTIALTEANEALMQADRAKTTFFQNISHELRTPLTLILGPMESYFSRNESTPLATAEVVVRNARRLLRLVNQLLDLQKITAGRLELEPTPIDTTLFLDRIFSSFQPYASSREVELIREYDSLPLILADEDKFEKCIFNYLSNALKFTPRGGRIILRAFINETGTFVETGGKQKFVRIEVEDNGMGIPPERISGLFTRFGHSEGSLTREQEGTGLGLSLVKELIELHGGNVSVKSEVNKGSVFSLEIPVSETISFPEKDFTKGNIQAQIELGDVVTRPVSNIVFPQNDNGTGHHILVVEDNADLRDHLANIFLHAGYRITFAENGEIGLSEVMKNPPNIIVTDLMMPKMSGAEMIRRIRSTSQHNGIPIVILTGSADTDTRKQMREVGADDYLAKPFDEQELLAVIRNLLALKSRERRMVGDLKSARAIQQHLLPRELPKIAGFQLASVYEPMEEVGGDFYDFVHLRDGSLGVFICDVSGHGMPAAMIASMSKILLGAYASEFSSPGKFLALLNDKLIGLTAGNFLTCYYGILRKTGETGSFSYASAGHPAALLLREKRIILLQGQGRAAGIVPWGDYTDNEINLVHGDRILMYTDGLIEAVDKNGESYDEERLADVFSKTSALNLQTQLDEILKEVVEFQGSRFFEDDVTLFSVEFRQNY